MSVRPHPSKSKTEPGRWWHIDCGHGSARKRLVFHGSYEDAVKIERGLRQQRPTEVPTVAPKIKELILPFLEWYKNEASPRTIRDIRFSIDLYFVPWFGSLQPRQLTLQHFNDFNVTDRPKGATDDRVNGATQSGSFSLLDGVNYWSFFALFSFVVFVPWGQFFGER